MSKRARILNLDPNGIVTGPAMQAGPDPAVNVLVAAGEPGTPIAPMPVFAVAHDVILTHTGITEEMTPREFLSFKWRDLPLPFYTAFTKAHGEDMVGGNPVTGEIQSMYLDGENVRGTVAWYDTPEGRLAAQLGASGSLRFVSVDAAGASVRYVVTDEETGEGKWVFDSYTIGAATQVGVPARERAAIGKVVHPGQGEHQAMAAAGDDGQPRFQVMKRAEFEPQLQTLVAAGIDRDTVMEGFARPEPADPLRYEGEAEAANIRGTEIAVPCVDPSGRTWSGYLAQWSTCHVGYQGQCKQAPADDDFHWFAREVLSADGVERQVGHITMDTGHANLTLTAAGAVAHYDDTGARVAYAEFVNGHHGIWGRGVINPAATDAQIENFHRSRISGDWRGRGGRLALIAALVVNYPGFPIPDLAFGADDTGNESLVAAGVMPLEPPTDLEVAAMASSRNNQTIADRIARSIGAPTAAEVREAKRRELAAKVGSPSRRVMRRR